MSSILSFSSRDTGVGDVLRTCEVGVSLLDDDGDGGDDDTEGVKAPREDPVGEAVGENTKLDVDPAILQNRTDSFASLTSPREFAVKGSNTYIIGPSVPSAKAAHNPALQGSYLFYN